ncbi:ornithine cyclodeaminase family protein [Brucella anthropi]|uniref:ornithine cyclodeaminase family protein n=1 Tax=Brucella anthropi TaxID=529 RepID=UPI002165EFDE|nr:ornithine cyclodeaminase family protein [Brucella anthropi]UVV70750.1 ornithine cyclodeaminase family protein [Brucella anthropi]
MQNEPRIIDARTAADLLPFETLIERLRRAYADGCHVPERHHHRVSMENETEATLLLMPAWSKQQGGADRYLGVKLVNVFPDNAQIAQPGLYSTYILSDGKTGAPLAFIDGNVITSRRTVAASALAADYLARKDADTLLVIGSGRVASLLPYAYAAVRKFVKVLIWDIHEQGAKMLAQKLVADGFNAEAVNALEPAVRQADVITSATLSSQPLVLGDWVKPGTHVDLIGAFTPRMRESDGALLQKASIFIDTEEAMIEGGDIVAAVKEGFIDRDSIKGTLQQLCSGTVKGRHSNIAISCFKAVGTALADLSAASLVYETMPAR